MDIEIYWFIIKRKRVYIYSKIDSWTLSDTQIKDELNKGEYQEVILEGEGVGDIREEQEETEAEEQTKVEEEEEVENDIISRDQTISLNWSRSINSKLTFSLLLSQQTIFLTLPA